MNPSPSPIGADVSQWVMEYCSSPKVACCTGGSFTAHSATQIFGHTDIGRLHSRQISGSIMFGSAIPGPQKRGESNSRKSRDLTNCHPSGSSHSGHSLCRNPDLLANQTTLPTRRILASARVSKGLRSPSKRCRRGESTVYCLHMYTTQSITIVIRSRFAIAGKMPLGLTAASARTSRAGTKRPESYCFPTTLNPAGEPKKGTGSDIKKQCHRATIQAKRNHRTVTKGQSVPVPFLRR